MHVVLLGGAGYIGSVAAEHLVSYGHDLTVVDGLIYTRDGDPTSLLPAGAAFTQGDLRDPVVLREALAGADVVVHLGGLVGEPACARDERLAVELNYAAPILAADAAVRAGVGRYVFFSSCSVYGSHEGTVDESTTPNPLGIYARTKVLAERRLPEVLGGIPTTILRLATVHGRSPRQRLDSVVNRMASRAVADGRIPLNGGGQRRPLVHVNDVVRVLAQALTMPGNHVWNVGSDQENHTIGDIARTVADAVPGALIDYGPELDEADARDYAVSFARLREALPGVCSTTLKQGVEEIARAVANGTLGNPAEAQYDNHAGLCAAVADDRVAVLGTPDCDRLHAEYQDVFGGGR
ncbi:NAD(P)-dependent oxidoreductase [Streptomyces sp. NBC_00654]|uniref:NAD-dependent epimerase/dehydratase family protein n=1 Tax=Streptomyces sp. NBC_00654 TaxID=2975799 RepID=UPI00225199E5|nr:NAD(P)-dependent oxidoreductase [Streptomyces sp. NBC_00654]MCX4970473.1 NAD(P)-dependent oxidoreductase [Streptomyces sp. NBC_00654]